MENKLKSKENKRLSWPFWLCFFTAHLLNVTTGISMVWTQTVICYLTTYARSNPGQLIGYSSTMKMMMAFSVAPLLSFILMAKLSDRVGRKISMRCLGIVYVETFFVTGFSNDNLYVNYIAFFIQGAALAGMFINVSIYSTEIADDINRAWIGCLFGLPILLGNIFSSSFAALELQLNTYSFICMLPAIVMVVLTFFIVESPSFLAGKQKRDDAIFAIKKIRNYTDIKDSEKEYDKIWNFNSSCHIEQKSLWALFRNESSKKAILLGLLLLIAQNLTGINIILNTALSVFMDAKLPLSPHSIDIIVVVVQIVPMLVSASTVSRYGQRSLLVLSSCICTLMLFCLSLYFYMLHINSPSINEIPWIAILLLILFLMGYGIGLASIPVVLVGDLFCNETRAVALSIVLTIQFLLRCVMNYDNFLLPHIIMLGYAIGSTICFYLIYRYLPETKGKSYQEIQDILSKSNKKRDNKDIVC